MWNKKQKLFSNTLSDMEKEQCVSPDLRGIPRTHMSVSPTRLSHWLGSAHRCVCLTSKCLEAAPAARHSSSCPLPIDQVTNSLLYSHNVAD